MRWDGTGRPRKRGCAGCGQHMRTAAWCMGAYQTRESGSSTVRQSTAACRSGRSAYMTACDCFLPTTCAPACAAIPHNLLCARFALQAFSGCCCNGQLLLPRIAALVGLVMVGAAATCSRSDAPGFLSDSHTRGATNTLPGSCEQAAAGDGVEGQPLLVLCTPAKWADWCAC